MFRVKIVAALLIVALFGAIHLAAPEFLPEVFSLLARGDIVETANYIQGYGSLAVMFSFLLTLFVNAIGFPARDNFFHGEHFNFRNRAGNNFIGDSRDGRRDNKFSAAEIFFPRFGEENYFQKQAAEFRRQVQLEERLHGHADCAHGSLRAERNFERGGRVEFDEPARLFFGVARRQVPFDRH